MCIININDDVSSIRIINNNVDVRDVINYRQINN